jgi:hypothetical protein
MTTLPERVARLETTQASHAGQFDKLDKKVDEIKVELTKHIDEVKNDIITRIDQGDQMRTAVKVALITAFCSSLGIVLAAAITTFGQTP